MSDKTNMVYQANWESLDSRPIPAWFQDYKFGIFIHWGVYSVPSWRGIKDEIFGSYSEWYYASVYSDYKNHDGDYHRKMYGDDFLYRDFAKDFKAECFDPDEWAELFKNSGAKYVVLTSKHHDGYCLWPTENKHKKNWRVTDVGPKIDLLGELSQAVRKKGLKMGVYYSIIDWETNGSHRPESGYFVPERDRKAFGIDEEIYSKEILTPQLLELVNKYQPELIFADGGEWDLTEDYTQTKEFLAWLYSESPVKDTIVVNDRFYSGMPGNHGDYYSTEYNDKEGFDEHPWEESRGIGQSYGYNRAESLDDYQSFEELVRGMVSIISKGGNFLLNVGPRADGMIPVIQEERLTQLGRWMNLNSDAVYGTRSGHKAIVNMPATTKAAQLYCFAFDIAPEIEIQVSNFRAKKAEILGLGECAFVQEENSIKVQIPELDLYRLLNDNRIEFPTYVIRLT